MYNWLKNMTRRQVLMLHGSFWAIFVVMLLVFRGFTTTVSFSKEEIQAKAAEYIDANGNFGDYLKFSDPEVILNSDSGRIGLKINVTASAMGRSGNGTVAATAHLAYHPSDATFYLADIKVEEIKIANVPAFAQVIMAEVVQKGLERLVPTMPIYTLKEDELAQRAAKLVLQKVEVTGGKLVATVGY